MTETRETTRLEKILAAMVGTAVGLSIICFFILLLSMPLGFSLDNAFGHVIVVLPVIGLPLGFVLMMTLLIVNIVRNRKNKAGNSGPSAKNTNKRSQKA